MKALGFLFGLWSFINGMAMVGAWMAGKHLIFAISVAAQFMIIALAMRVLKK